MSRYSLDRKLAGLLIVDVQEKLIPYIDHNNEMMSNILKLIQGAQVFNLPVLVTEQYPKGLSQTVAPIKLSLPDETKYWEKTAFSCLGDNDLRAYILSLPVQQWIVVGIEAHVCVLQTVRDLLDNGKQVVVVNDAISSRSIYDYSTGIAEMRDFGARISSTETVLFDLTCDSNIPEFKSISEIIKS